MQNPSDFLESGKEWQVCEKNSNFFFIMLYYVECVSLKKWGPCDQKKKNPNKQAWYLIQELLGKIEKTGCSRNNWSLTLICIHLRIPSVIIHTWPWLQQLETNSSAPNLMVTSQERSRSHTCWVSQSLAQVLSTPHSLHKACTPLEILGIMRGSEPKEHCVLLQPFPGWWK